MTKRKISLCYKFLTITSLATGIFLNISNTKSVISLISYYTSQSNIICLIAFICFVYIEIRYKDIQKNDIYYLVKGAIIVSILITAIIYRVALAPNGFEMDALRRSVKKNHKELANLLVHTISPLLVICDYFLFDEKGRFKLYYPIIWLVLPLNYVLYVYTYSYYGGEFYSVGGSRKYAYFFLDYENIGKINVLKWIIIIAIFIEVISYIFVVFDLIRGRGKNKKS